MIGMTAALLNFVTPVPNKLFSNSGSYSGQVTTPDQILNSNIEIRSSKSETNQSQINQNPENPKPRIRFELVWNFEFFHNFEFVSNFGFRASIFLFSYLRVFAPLRENTLIRSAA
jgi:hypothetical protein